MITVKKILADADFSTVDGRRATYEKSRSKQRKLLARNKRTEFSKRASRLLGALNGRLLSY